MIEASISAVSGLIISFLVIAALVAVPTALVAKARSKPVFLRTVLAVHLAGVVAVTLLPGNAGLESGQCDTGLPTHLLTSSSALLNIALFAPGAMVAVLIFRRPVTVAAAFACLSGGVEVLQAMAPLGRSCSATDLAANVTGAALGTIAGIVLVRLQRKTYRRPAQDVILGAVIAGVGAVALAGFFHFRIESVDVVAADDRTHKLAEETSGADVWIAAAAEGFFGSDTQVKQTSIKNYGKRVRVTAETNRGTVSGWWPEKSLERAWSSNNRGDEGKLAKDQVAAAADKFARKWFPESVSGSRQVIRSIGEGPTKAYWVVYRRYSHGVMMPMRLDVTITTAGRVIGFVARTVEDPKLPSVTVDVREARKLAEKKTGLPSDSTSLLAQKVAGQWRPVWLVGSGEKDVAIDAATGAYIPEPKGSR